MIKFADLKIEDKEILQAVSNVLSTGQFISGEYNKKFSSLWAQECGAEYCISVASGMAALISILKALKETENITNRYVVVPNLSFAATTFAVVESGFIPVYCPVDERGLLDQEVCLKIIKSLKAQIVLPVYLYGQWFQIDSDILKNTFVVEDACQAHGVFKDIQGKAAAFSFYPSKNLGAGGDAGAIVTNDWDLNLFCKRYISYGDDPGTKYTHKIIGNNLRMDEIQACILYEKLQLGYLQKDQEIRKKLATHYRDLGLQSFTQLDNNSYHLYPILDNCRDVKHYSLKFQGIETGYHYPNTLSEVCPGVTKFLKGDWAKAISRQVLTLPIGPHLSEVDVAQVSKVFHEVV